LFIGYKHGWATGDSLYFIFPKEKIYQLRLDMAKEGLPEGEQGGYKIFEKEKIGEERVFNLIHA
jgi:flagellar biosynthesis/type III secretory pathway M-ring protein FliF/YscJ